MKFPVIGRIHKSIQPYAENPELATEYSEEELEAISQSDIVIYLSNKDGVTSKLEMGAAMILNFIKRKPSDIYAVGEFNNASPWLINPRVMRRKSIDEVIKELA